jgi:serine/threonine-protein kinase
MAEHALGHADAARAVLDELVSRFGHAFAYQIATVRARRGERDEAFAWLQRAHDQHDGGLTIMKVDPLLASLRSDPRHAALLKKWGFPE